MYKFSLRFYGQPEHKIIECIDRLKALVPEITGHEIHPLTQSMNMMLPCPISQCRQVYLLMPEAVANTMPRRADCMAVYQQYATAPGIRATAVVRRKGDPAHGI